jgi:hypothetical protein
LSTHTAQPTALKYIFKLHSIPSWIFDSAEEFFISRIIYDHSTHLILLRSNTTVFSHTHLQNRPKIETHIHAIPPNTNMYTTTCFVIVLAIMSSLSAVVNAAKSTYALTDDLSHKNFFPAFSFYSDTDPTKGFVQYQDRASAIKKGLVGYIQDTQSAFIGVDYTSKDPKGRTSVRLESTKNFNHGLLIADIAHMPASTCGVWPAYWLLGKQEWPIGGEIDILEGVNDYDSNAVTLHTSARCVVDNSTSPAMGVTGHSSAPFTGFMESDDCDVAAKDQGKNVGCSIHAPDSLPSITQTGGDTSTQALASYGTPFNANKGGIYALEWTPSFISVYFLPYASPLYTSAHNTTPPDPSQWGAPMAHFSGANCDFKKRFKDMRIIFDTTFCGEWAGKEWKSGGCMKKTGTKTCEEYVRKNPAAFEEAFWEIRGLKWFQKGAAVVAAGHEKGGVKARGRWDRR